jgi:hypothetical protein
MTDSKHKKQDEGEESTFAEPPRLPFPETRVLYLGIDHGTSRSSVAASNGVRETISPVSYQGRGQPQAAQEGHPLRRRGRRSACR